MSPLDQPKGTELSRSAERHRALASLNQSSGTELSLNQSSGTELSPIQPSGIKPSTVSPTGSEPLIVQSSDTETSRIASVEGHSGSGQFVSLSAISLIRQQAPQKLRKSSSLNALLLHSHRAPSGDNQAVAPKEEQSHFSGDNVLPIPRGVNYEDTNHNNTGGGNNLPHKGCKAEGHRGTTT